MRVVCQQTILMKYYTLFVIFEKGKILNFRLLQIIGDALWVNFEILTSDPILRLLNLIKCRFRARLKSTWIYRTVLNSSWKLNLPWKVFEKNSKVLKSPWILPITGGFNTVFGDLNQYKIVVPLFGAAYAAWNKGTTILY